MARMNIFLSTRRLVGSKEDHLTEFVAAALDSDPLFRERYSSLILADFAKRNGWAHPQIVAVMTQKSFPGCCPDLVLNLSDGHVIACEHKIDAAETIGSLDDGTSMLQLERYLRLPVDGVTYFRSSWHSPSVNVLNNPKYVRPLAHEHFLWSDLYPALEVGSTELVRTVRDAFEVLGYTPPVPVLGDLFDPDSTTRDQNRKNLRKLWHSTRSALREMGWRVGTGSICELYLQGNPQSIADQIYISPYRTNGRVLLFRVTPREANDVGPIMHRLMHTAEALAIPIEASLESVKRAGGERDVVDVTISLQSLHGTSKSDALEQSLRSYVVSLTRAVDPPITLSESDQIGDGAV
jgi:hypothetical protein